MATIKPLAAFGSTVGNFDFVILGAGGGGCAAAAALCRKYPAAKVALVEAGSDKWQSCVGSTALKVPMLAPVAWRCMNSGLFSHCTWNYSTTKQEGLNGRPVKLRRGRGLGGHSIINDTTYLRGNRQDYEGWMEGAGEGWTADDIIGAIAPLRTSKTLFVERPPRTIVTTPLNASFANVCEALELQEVESLNVENPHPQVAVYESTTYKGQRLDAFTAHCTKHPRLDEAHQPAVDNLTVITGAFALKANWEPRANGAPSVRSIDVTAAETSTGRPESSKASTCRIDCGKLIVCLGALETPQFLQRSGVGVKDVLGELGINHVASNAHVGENMLCQPSMYLTTYFARQERSKSFTIRNLSYLREQWAEYKLSKQGAFSSFIEYGALIHSQRELSEPDARVDFMPWLVNYQTGSAMMGRGFSVRLTMIRGISTPGFLRASRDASEGPRVELNLLQRDRHATEEAAAWAQMLIHPSLGIVSDKDENPEGYTHPFEYYMVTMANPVFPALDVKSRRKLVANSTIVDAGTIVGTCALGKAVGSNLALHGVDGVYVADSSVIPKRMNAEPNIMARVIGSRIGAFV